MKQKKTIKIKFSGMGGKFDPQNNFISNILKKYYTVELSDNPDYLIYSVNSSDYLKYNCVRIFYTAENIVPDFNICDYAIGFHYMDFGDRYCRYPLYMVDGFKAYSGDDYASDLIRAQHKQEVSQDYTKTDFCSFVYSNGDAAICREKIFDALSNYKKVNSGGRYRNNIGGPVVSKLEFQKKHRFVIAFENSTTPGYATEKIVHAFAAGSVPIYWGNPDITKEFNAGSFINCHDFGLKADGDDNVIQEIVSKIIELDQNENEYKKMLATPAFADSNYVSNVQKTFEEFLLNIFSQSKEASYRRNLLYWGKRYERKQIIGNAFYWQCRKFIPIRDFMIKMRRLFTRKK